MPTERKKSLCMDAMRHAEYYGMQQTFDELYAQSKAGNVFPNLMEKILSSDNIMLAYRNIKTNTGSYTAGTDKQNMGDIGRLTPTEVIHRVRKIVTGSEHGYRPKPVRRKEIPKPNGKTRPLGIPCIWDRLIQQCIKQILEPICEAKFSNNSYGFRPNRSVEHAISRTYSLLQRAHLHYVLEFDIKGFFDNVDHGKLMRQLWSLGIQDKQLLFVIKRILKAPIRMPDGSTVYPEKGTPQGGIISPLLANVVLNELDHWVDSQWVEHPLANRYGTRRMIRTSEVFDKSKGYCKMRKTNLKEMFIVRYAEDFRIFCRMFVSVIRSFLVSKSRCTAKAKSMLLNPIFVTKSCNWRKSSCLSKQNALRNRQKEEYRRTKLVCSMKWCLAYRIITGLQLVLVWTAAEYTAKS